MKSYLLAAVFPIALAACSQASQTNPPVVSDPSLLNAYHWQLTDAQNTQKKRIDTLFVRVDKPVTLDFNNNRFNVRNTCNKMMGGYTIAGSQITFTAPASTLMLCPDQKLMALDEEVSKRLQGTMAFTVQKSENPQLQLTTTDGDVLLFTGQPTPETRYGGQAETVFFEVAPQTKACSHPLIPNKQCLQIREVFYDKQGLKAKTPGEWQNFYQDIEGYTHENGIRNVVRVKRYKIANPPADAPNMAYVLDMVVSSEIVK